MLAGSGRVKLDDEIVAVEAPDAIRVATGTVRQFEAGPDGLELIAFGAPRTDASAAKDAQMLGDVWGD